MNRFRILLLKLKRWRIALGRINSDVARPICCRSDVAAYPTDIDCPTPLHHHNRLYTRINSDAVYLTFDDGPNPNVTPKLLDLLQESNATATFFVTGHSLENEGASHLLKQIASLGHTIGNHGFVHRRKECPRFCEMHQRIQGHCGADTRIIRPPHGQANGVYRYLEIEPTAVAVTWSVWFWDWLPLKVDQMFECLVSEIRPGAIVLLHDGVAPDAIYADRDHVITLTRLIVEFCAKNSFPVRGLHTVFPEAYKLT